MSTYRHEMKYRINAMDAASLLMRLRAVLAPDPNVPSGPNVPCGHYTVRSLYFDDPYSTALVQKLYGVDRRYKYRLRIYNLTDGKILLERKERVDGVGTKLSVQFTREEADRFLAGDIALLLKKNDPVATLFYSAFQSGLLRPHRIVEYDRTAFVHPSGNVRITLDRHLRSAPGSADFFTARTMPVPMSCDVLEVKFDRYLPSHIAHLVHMDNHFVGPNSKYLNSSVYDGLT